MSEPRHDAIYMDYLTQQFQLAVLPEHARLTALHLPACRHGQTSRAKQQNLIGVDLVLIDYGLPNAGHELVRSDLPTVGPFHLLDHDQLFSTIFVHGGESCTPMRAQCRMRALYCILDVLWIMIHSPDDNHIFQPTCDEEFPG